MSHMESPWSYVVDKTTGICLILAQFPSKIYSYPGKERV